MQKVDYTYNIRDWLTGINNPYNPGSDYFAMSLGYTTGDNPQYNGNISEMHWKTVSFGFNDYQFDYDGANRLKEAVFTGTGQHNTSYSYDKNGNILSLTRQGQLGGGPEFGDIDALTYNYNGNQLNYVNDNETAPYQDNGFKEETRLTTAEYTYDANGNMITDLNKNLVVNRYNYLNLPEQIQISMNGLNHINYLSPIAIGGPGTKLAKQTVKEGNPNEEITTDYCGGFVYEDGELQYLLTSEGRVVFNPDGTHDYQYFMKDHLGNTRVTFGEDGIIQEDSYYPFGMLERSGNPAIAGTMADLSQQNGQDLPNKYLYNAEKPEISDFIVFRASSKNHKKQSFFIFRDGKELQDDFGLDWYDYGARFYDPVIGRWQVVDPMAELGRRWSPFAYVENNPINMIDPDGRDGVAVIDIQNQTITVNAVYYVQTNPSIYNNTAYSAKEISRMQESINTTLNKKGYSVSEGDYAGYKVQFNFEFKEGGSSWELMNKAEKEKYGDIPIGNTFQRADDRLVKMFAGTEDEKSGTISYLGGVTQDHKQITMNAASDTKRNRIHEMFHTLFFDNDDAEKGIGSYKRMDMPNQDDINNLINNETLPKIEMEYEERY